jgi:anthranilate/para-aminobenzoate synthase component II
MQAIAIFGGLTVSRNVRMMHGKTSQIQHQGVGLFTDVDPSISVMRYHSLIPQCPTAQLGTAFEYAQNGHQISDVKVTAYSMHEDVVEIMAIQLVHQGSPVVGVQFHPESYYPVMNSVPFYGSYGKRMVQNFLAML